MSMAKLRASGMKIVAEKLQVCGNRSGSSVKEVKGGHFVVFAVENDKTKRFVVPLSYLNHPGFLVLLEQAAEEFGFVHKGALRVPCQWSEMERLLAGNARRI